MAPGHLHDLYGIDISPDLISTVTDAVLDDMATWQQRPLDVTYPLVFFEAIRVKIYDEVMVRSKAIHIALGVRVGGAKEVLGLWLEQNEGAKFWLRVMNGLRNRGTEDILLAGGDPHPAKDVSGSDVPVHCQRAARAVVQDQLRLH